MSNTINLHNNYQLSSFTHFVAFDQFAAGALIRRWSLYSDQTFAWVWFLSRLVPSLWSLWVPSPESLVTSSH